MLDWGPMPGSYGWVFPKGDVLTVGVIAARGQGERTRQYLRDFTARLGLAGYPAARDSGHLTHCRADDSPLRRGRVLVAGDAAGLLEPWTREGISFALRSGTLAGAAAADAAAAPDPERLDQALDAYPAAVGQALVPEMDAGRRLLTAFTRHPRRLPHRPGVAERLACLCPVLPQRAAVRGPGRAPAGRGGAVPDVPVLRDAVNTSHTATRAATHSTDLRNVTGCIPCPR